MVHESWMGSTMYARGTLVSAGQLTGPPPFLYPDPTPQPSSTLMRTPTDRAIGAPEQRLTFMITETYAARPGVRGGGSGAIKMSAVLFRSLNIYFFTRRGRRAKWVHSRRVSGEGVRYGVWRQQIIIASLPPSTPVRKDRTPAEGPSGRSHNTLTGSLFTSPRWAPSNRWCR